MAEAFGYPRRDPKALHSFTACGLGLGVASSFEIRVQHLGSDSWVGKIMKIKQALSGNACPGKCRTITLLVHSLWTVSAFLRYVSHRGLNLSNCTARQVTAGNILALLQCARLHPLHRSLEPVTGSCLDSPGPTSSPWSSRRLLVLHLRLPWVKDGRKPPHCRIA